MTSPVDKLPLWRLLMAVFVLGGMVAVLLALAPVYLRNFELQQYVQQLAQKDEAGSLSDPPVIAGITARAHELSLPVEPSDVHIARSAGKLRIDLKYAVQKDFGLYQVDLHFHPSAVSR